MSTKAQTKANRQNAQKSTGPQTVEGKAVVSQNAVKHGLFAAEAVITGENPADYEAYHDQFLAELAPVGMLESLLAERIVSLGWRLQRAERMQNQAIEDMIESDVTNPKARDRRKNHCNNEGIRPDDPRYDSDHLALGRIAAGDWSYFRVLDRMLLYERRIENSLHKTINKLKTQQMIRVIQQADARKQETATRPAEKKCDLKKQSQFPPALMGATSYVKGGYGNMPACGIEENKANSNPNKANQACPEHVEWSQSQPSAPTEGAGKREKSVVAATG